MVKWSCRKIQILLCIVHIERIKVKGKIRFLFRNDHLLCLDDGLTSIQGRCLHLIEIDASRDISAMYILSIPDGIVLTGRLDTRFQHGDGLTQDPKDH